MAYSRPNESRRGHRSFAVIALAAMVGLSVYALLRGDAHAPLDDGLCPDAPAESLAVFLLDLRKPLHPGWADVPGALVRDTALGLPPGTKLRVYTVAERFAAPLATVAELCTPALLHVNDDGARNRTSICDTQSLAMPQDGNQAAYCARLDIAQRRIGELARRRPKLPLANAYLVEAIEEVRLGFAARSGRHSLYIVSDMMQHARWYSHLEMSPKDWALPTFDERRRTRAVAPVAPLSAAVLPVQVFYLPRHGSTGSQPVRDLHQGFWREYFLAMGLAAEFADQPTMPAYAATPRADDLGRLARLALQREQLRRQRTTLGETLALVQAERAQLEEARTRAAAERSELASRHADLASAEAEEHRLIAVERAATTRLNDALAARRRD